MRFEIKEQLAAIDQILLGSRSPLLFFVAKPEIEETLKNPEVVTESKERVYLRLSTTISHSKNCVLRERKETR